MEEKRIHVLFNFAEDYLLDPENKKDFSGMRIVYLSSLMKEKGIFILLEALLELEKRNLNYQARIAGNMDPKSKEAILAVMGKLKNTVYLGTVEGTEKKRLMQWSNVFVLPTFYKMEGQPISIIEAMATGNLIVTARLEGIMDLMRHKEQGFFLEDNSTENLVETLIFIEKNMDLTERIALNNKDYFLKNFTLSRFREQLLKILNN
jgi:glycosyltransferase involved in cell wall biosynthesis